MDDNFTNNFGLVYDKDHMSSHESTGGAGSIGVRIFVATPKNRPLTEEEKQCICKATDDIHRLVIKESLRIDPEEIAYAAAEKEKIISLFDLPIFVEEIPNGYSSQTPRPWFIVTTKIGRIKIGWRSSVILIDWFDSCLKRTADELFPNENVTKDGRMIHAWGYEKAKQYLTVITNWREPLATFE